MIPTPVSLTVFPDDCDAFGHLNQAAFLTLFERARWQALAFGPGMDLFQRAGVWPAVRRATIDYHAPASPGPRCSLMANGFRRARPNKRMQLTIAS